MCHELSVAYIDFESFRIPFCMRIIRTLAFFDNFISVRDSKRFQNLFLRAQYFYYRVHHFTISRLQYFVDWIEISCVLSAEMLSYFPTKKLVIRPMKLIWIYVAASDASGKCQHQFRDAHWTILGLIHFSRAYISNGIYGICNGLSKFSRNSSVQIYMIYAFRIPPFNW